MPLAMHHDLLLGHPNMGRLLRVLGSSEGGRRGDRKRDRGGGDRQKEMCFHGVTNKVCRLNNT
jgi:hypothetical protein